MNCLFCREPLTSDDYKLDRVVTDSTNNNAAHWGCCVERASRPNYIEPRDREQAK